MAILLKESGSTIRPMALEYTLTAMVLFIKASGLRTNRMAKA
jgi:hypothetical protein